MSPLVQALPSSQAPPAAAPKLHSPVLPSQVSVVQTLSSLQSTADLPAQLPLAQASPLVHRLPSSQLPLAATATQPLAGSQLSVVQALLSLQRLTAPGSHLPLAQASLVLQLLPSSQAAVLAVAAQVPVLASQLSSVHGLLSVQTLAAPA